MSDEAVSSATLQAFLQSLHGPFESYGTSWREDFDLQNLVALSGAELGQAIAALRWRRGDRGRAMEVFREVLERSPSPGAVTIAAATVRDDPPAALLPALRARLDDDFASVRQNCAMALAAALPLPREGRGRRCGLLEGRLSSELASVRRAGLAQLDGLVADVEAGRPVDRWMEADGPESPAFQGVLARLRDRAGSAYDTAALATLAGLERERAT